MDDNAIAVIIEPLDAAKKAAVKKAFAKMETALAAITGEYDELMAKDITTEVCTEAKILRLRISKVRIDGEKWKTKEKKQYNEAGNAIQKLYNSVKEDTAKKEEALKEVEDHFQREADKKIAELRDERLEILEPYNVDSTFVDLGNMTEEAWKSHHAGIVAAHENAAAIAEKDSAEQKAADLQQEIFDSRTKLLLPYGQFNPLIDLYPETTSEEFERILTSMELKMSDFNDKQALLIKENTELKKASELIKEGTTDVNKFKQDTLFGFSSGAPVKEDLGTDKDASLGEMLGFDEPEEESVILAGQEIKLPIMRGNPCSPNAHLPLRKQIEGRSIREQSGKDDKGILQDLAETLQMAKQHVKNQDAKSAIVAAANSLRGAAMMLK